MDNIFQQQVDELDFSDEEEVKKKQEDDKAEDAAKELSDSISTTEKRIRAPEWWTVENFKPKEASYWIGKEKVSLPDCIDAIKQGASAIIAGATTGAGKSHLACAIIRECAKQSKRGARHKDFNLFRLAEVDRFRANGGLKDAVDVAKTSDYWLLDDAGKNPLYRSALELTYYGNVLFDIVDERAERRRPTIITTRAANKEELVSALGADFIRRVQMAEREKNTAVSIFLS